jgi:hypothetical protein
VEAKTPVAVSITGRVMIVLEISISVRVSQGVDVVVGVSPVSPAGRVIGVPVISVSVSVSQGVDAVYVVIVIPGDGLFVDPIPVEVLELLWITVAVEVSWPVLDEEIFEEAGVDLVAVLGPCAGVLVEGVNCGVEVLMMGVDPKDRDV